MSKQQIVLGLIFASSAPALAQTVIVSPQRKVNPPGADWYECSVAVRIGQPSEVVVAAIHVPALADPDVGYGITLNGGTSFINGILALGVDPGVVADPATGRMWISALKNCGNSRIGVASKEPGGLVFGAPCCIYAGTGLFIDKPLMAISPDGSNHVMMYLMRKDTCESGPTCSHGVYATSTDDDAGCPWPTTARVQPPSSGNQGDVAGRDGARPPWFSAPVES